MDEITKTISFTYKIDKSLMGRNEIVTIDSKWFVGHGQVAITDSRIGSWSDDKDGLYHYSANFDRITKLFEYRISVQDKDHPGYLKYDNTFDGSCVATTRG
jgi:hypothetical protein